MSVNEAIVEVAAIEWFEELGLVGRLRAATGRLKPADPEEARASDKESLSHQKSDGRRLNR